MIIDVTLPLDESTPPFPGDPGLNISALSDYAGGQQMRLSAISLSAHLGTHVDAPFHFIPNGKRIQDIPLETLVGPAELIEIVTTSGISRRQLEPLVPLQCRRLLIKTSTQTSLYPRPHAWLEPDAAEFLVERNVLLVGLDSPSVDSITAEHAPAHHVLLRNEVVIVENLALHAVEPMKAELICLPLNLVGLEGSPARVILRGYE